MRSFIIGLLGIRSPIGRHPDTFLFKLGDKIRIKLKSGAE